MPQKDAPKWRLSFSAKGRWSVLLAEESHGPPAKTVNLLGYVSTRSFRWLLSNWLLPQYWVNG